jgi:selenide,water dikinase
LLAPVRLPDDPRVLVSTATADDAGVVKVRDDLALVLTVDFFPPVVDDPVWFGRIAAANSLSDVYAMGGEPLAAVSVLALPKEIPEEAPPKILQGAVDTCALASTALVGGHTVKDKEVKFGLSVTGTVHPDRIVSNVGARPGDALVLTKPLGSGFLSTAIRASALPEEVALGVQGMMAELNRGAAAAMVEVGVHAATDITGFGLLGHAIELAAGSDVTLRVDAAAVPWVEGLDPFVNDRFMCGGLHRNREYADAGNRVRWSGGTKEQHMVLTDPQTSGGLLIAVPGERRDALLEALERHDVATRAVVGEVVARDAGDVEVL